MKVISVIGARPQFIKAAILSRALREAGVPETIIHTGQHYDANMSSVFFDELEIPAPTLHLGVGSGSHAFQTGECMVRLEKACRETAADAVIVFGDTNSTLAGALVAAKQGLPIAHVEAGLRSFDRSMPEEINRVVADRLSEWLFCPTAAAVANLHAEGIAGGVFQTGDIMYDAALKFGDIARTRSGILGRLNLEEDGYVLATIHRDFNTDSMRRLQEIVEGLLASPLPVVFPAHPRVMKQLGVFDLAGRLRASPTFKLIEPVGYIDMTRLEMSAAAIVTDSGGVQKEACFHRVPCITVRPSTEWVETIAGGWNRLVDASRSDIASLLHGGFKKGTAHPSTYYGEGDSAAKMVAGLTQ